VSEWKQRQKQEQRGRRREEKKRGREEEVEEEDGVNGEADGRGEDGNRRLPIEARAKR
jgi:hypothetical protein